MDIEDNADALVFRKALALLLARLVACLEAAKARIVEHKSTVCMAWTHLQPAEPTTLGYRFANYAQDLLIDIELLEFVRDHFVRGKGMKGAVGTSASFEKLLGNADDVRRLEEKVMGALGLDYVPVSTQTYPRKLDYILLSCLASIAASCHKFGLDLRVQQSPGFGRALGADGGVPSGIQRDAVQEEPSHGREDVLIGEAGLDLPAGGLRQCGEQHP